MLEKRDIIHRGLNARTFLLLAMFMALVLLGSACATVPLTGRTQLSLVSDSTLLQMSLTQYDEVLHNSKLSKDKAKLNLIKGTGARIARATEEFLRENGLAEQIKKYQWEFNLIEDDKTVNAWCMPGGKIAFYTGILPVCKDQNGVAVVMGHEVAHAVANHGGERMSQGLLVQLGGIALAVALHDQPAETAGLFLAAYGVGATVGLILPYSRKHEYEADRIGLTLMAMAGYDPRAAVGLWQRMNQLSEEKGSPPEFLSTHPAPASRIQYIEQYLPEAMQHYRTSLQGPGPLRTAYALREPGPRVALRSTVFAH